MGDRIAGKMAWIVAAALLALTLVWSAPAPSPRLVAVGDVHGDFDAFVGILQRASLVDANRHWSGRNAILVQTGDILDRGPKSRAVMDFLMELQKEAPRQNGRVVALMGNHEAMNVFGDMRYVTASDFESYADGKSEQRRATAYESYAARSGQATPVTREEWMSAHPPGFIEHRAAFGPNGKYGKWLRSLPAVAKINDSIFLHGGIKPEIAVLNVNQINDRIAMELKAFDAYLKYMVDEKIALPFYTLKELTDAANAALNDPTNSDPDRKKFLEGFLGYGSWLSINPDGPLWFRGYAQWSDVEGIAQIKNLTEIYGVARFVVGHTPQVGQIVTRFDGRVFLIDTGMLSSYFEGGVASALEIMDGKITAIYPDKTEPLP
jgi:Calcineurin-like phosphoesterase